jgi:hypothetical protein
MSRFKTVLIDSDQLCYSVGFAAKSEPLAFALQTVKNSLNKIVKECDAEERVLYVKGHGNFREDIAVTRGYKANRVSTPKPAHYPDILAYLLDVQNAIPCHGMEADDAVSIELYKDFLLAGGDRDKATVVLSSGDKDLNNTPGWHHNPRTGEVVWYSDYQATRHFWYQMLMGDLTDNIKGIPKLPSHVCTKYGISKTGVGKAGASKLMKEAHDLEQTEAFVYELYLHWGISEGYSEEVIKDYIVENAQLLWMVRELDEGGNPIMFTLNEVLYETAKARFEGIEFSEEFGYGSSRRGGGYDSDNTGGWESDDSDESNAGLRITPSRTRAGRTP